MSRSPPEAKVGLSARGSCWRLPGDEAREGDIQQLGQAMKSWPRGTRAAVIAAHDVAVHWMQSPPAAVQSMRELKLVAGARCAQLYGGSGTAWWVAGDWDAEHPFPCAALPRAQVRAVEEVAIAAGVSLGWHSLWSRVCTRDAASIPAAGWSALRTRERVVLWHCTTGRVDAITTLAAASADEAQRAVAQQVQIELLQDAALRPGAVHWVTLEGSSEARIAMDFA